MKKKAILLLGGNKLNEGIVHKFREKGYLIYVIDWNQSPFLTGDKHYQIDVKDGAKIVESIKKDGKWEQIEFAYSSIDLAVPSVAYINRQLGLNTISDEGIENAVSKSRMTKKWNEDNLLNRFSYCYDEFSDRIVKLNENHKIIIKPDNSASSRGITIVEKCCDIGFIKSAFDTAQKEATNNRVIVEEFVEGVEFTVEMIGDMYGNVCVYGISIKSHTKNTNNNKIAIKLHYNAIGDELQERIADYAIRCYKSLGLSASLGHLEIILKKDNELSPVEIGARSSGFIASDLVDIVSGVDYLGEFLNVLKGGKVQKGLHKQKEKSSVYFFYDFPENFQIKKKCKLLDFCENTIKSRYYDRDSIKQGNIFSNIENDNSRWGYEILEGPRNVLTKEYLENVEQKMLLSMAGEM